MFSLFSNLILLGCPTRNGVTSQIDSKMSGVLCEINLILRYLKIYGKQSKGYLYGDQNSRFAKTSEFMTNGKHIVFRRLVQQIVQNFWISNFQNCIL